MTIEGGYESWGLRSFDAVFADASLKSWTSGLRKKRARDDLASGSTHVI